MSDANKQAVQRYYREIWNQGNLARIDELFTDDYVNSDPATPGNDVHGRDGLRELQASYKAAFPDLTFTIHEQVAEGDTVVSRWTAQGTQAGPLLGMPPTGKQGQPTPVVGVTITRFRAGRIAADWVVWDTLGLLRQLGYVG